MRRFQDFITNYMVSPQSAFLLCIHSEEGTELEAFSLENIASKMDNISKDLAPNF